MDYFAGDVAARYDDDAAAFDPAAIAPVVDFLSDAAGGGAALEFAVGTGRIALPLAARGVPVSGIDLSPDMLARLRDKPGGDGIPVEVGDMAQVRVAGEFSLVYLVFNTILNLTSQAAQVACFQNAAAHLRPGGAFVVEVLVPGLQRLPEGERLVPFDLAKDHWGIDEYDVVAQKLWSHHMYLEDGAWVQRSVPFRYAWPSELDLMARIAGLERTQRWGGWHKEPFTATSRSHVSVWVKR